MSHGMPWNQRTKPPTVGPEDNPWQFQTCGWMTTMFAYSYHIGKPTYEITVYIQHSLDLRTTVLEPQALSLQQGPVEQANTIANGSIQ